MMMMMMMMMLLNLYRGMRRHVTNKLKTKVNASSIIHACVYVCEKGFIEPLPKRGINVYITNTHWHRS